MEKEFNCLQCGNCCRWEGVVKLTEGDLHNISSFLGLTIEDFCSKYTELRDDRRGLALIEKSDGSCVFLEDNKCLIHPVKPKQCIDFPIKWRVPEIEKLCPGFNSRKLYFLTS